jgi:hypothetical protein
MERHFSTKRWAREAPDFGIPNGTLVSPLFGISQWLAGGFSGSQNGGNRSTFLQGRFGF